MNFTVGASVPYSFVELPYKGVRKRGAKGCTVDWASGCDGEGDGRGVFRLRSVILFSGGNLLRESGG